MKTVTCPECGTFLTVNEHTFMTICTHCHKCIVPINGKHEIKIISTEESLKDIDPFLNDTQIKNLQLVRCPKWNNCTLLDENKCPHKKLHEKFEDCEISCVDNIKGENILICNDSCN